MTENAQPSRKMRYLTMLLPRLWRTRPVCLYQGGRLAFELPA